MTTMSLSQSCEELPRQLLTLALTATMHAVWVAAAQFVLRCATPAGKQRSGTQVFEYR
jgi:hypothetical protein